MRIAYIILVHKLPDQLVRLVRKLNTESTTFFIHVDKKTDQEIFNRIEKSLKLEKNVHFLHRYPCQWGDFGCVEATLAGIERIVKGNLKPDYVILLTGQDYPIKSNEYIHEILEKNNRHSFIDYFALPYEYWRNGGLDRIAYWHFFLREHIFPFPKANVFRSLTANRVWNALVSRITIRRRLPGQLAPFGGNPYWCLSQECIEYIYDYIQQNHHFKKFFKYVRNSDEIFFQTILLNSDRTQGLVNNNLRYIDWSAHLPNPAILGKQDFDKFIHSGNLFARKFDATVDSEVLDMIDKVIA